MAYNPTSEVDISAEESAQPPSSKVIVDLANRLLMEFNISTQIEDVCDVTASLFVVLYESLFSDRLPGIIRQPTSKEDEVHNCQIVIDVLSTEVVKDSLSHIRGIDIVAGDNTAILNLLDIFSYLLEYVVKRIETEADLNDTGLASTSEAEQEATTGGAEVRVGQACSNKMKDAPKTKLGSSATSNMTNNNGAHLQSNERRKGLTDRNENRKEFEPHDVITHEDFYAMSYGGISLKGYAARAPSPITHDTSQSLLGQKTIDSDFDTDMDKSEKRIFDPLRNQPKVAWDEKFSKVTGAPETVIDGVTLRACAPTTKGSPWESSAYNIERPIPSFSATMPTSSCHIDSQREDPLRATVGPISYKRQERPRPAIPSDAARLAKELNAQSLNSAYKQLEESHQLPAKSEKRVAFASLRDSGIHDYGSGFQSDWPASRGYISNSESEITSSASPTAKEMPAMAQGQRNHQRAKPGSQKKPGTITSRQQFAKYLAQNRQPELGAAHMTLKTEDRALQRKQEILRKFYEQDHQDFLEDVEYILERDRQKSKELEEECLKKCSHGPVRKKLVKSCKAQAPKKPRIKKPAVSKLKEKEDLLSPSPQPLHLESEEDLLPLLLEEFPHLHLSEHTWHELWKQGLSQIEALTRAHQESQRKKSRAQCQLEDAAHRHELLADIMKKQLEHTKRLRDIKEQKQQQITTRNKMHEKRIQSARARRYYNEYQVRARSKQLKRRTKEEMVFRDLFKEALNIQKERIKDVRQYASDQRKRQESRRQDEIDSLENFYHDQFEMLAEKLTKEQKETEVRDAAQQQILQRFKRELRKKMENEIKQYQEELFRDDDDVHFRKCDADRVLRQLHMARFSAKV